MDKLLELGFKPAATTSIENSNLFINIGQNENATNVLYAFVIVEGENIEDWKVRYIGHTRKTFRNRMYGYQLGNGHAVNNRIHNEVKSVIESGKKIIVYLLNDTFNLNIHSLDIDIAAGLEYSLIDFYRKYNIENEHPPLQNIAGNKTEVTVNGVDDNEEDLTYLVEEESNEIQNSFTYTLSKTYWNHPSINIPKEFSDYFGEQGTNVMVEFYNENIRVRSLNVLVNRNAVPNQTPRLYFGQNEDGIWFQNWKHQNYNQGDSFTINIIGNNRLMIKKEANNN
jgi:hypothetical protein